jgi:hypothetical protein
MVSPGIFAVMVMMGQPGVLSRLERAAGVAASRGASAPETSAGGAR